MDFYIEHIGLPARDPVGLKDWYVRVLDGKEIYADGNQPPAFLVQLPGGVVIEIYPATSSLKETTDNKLSGWRHIALRVESLDGARAQLEKRGVTFTKPVGPAVGGGTVLYFVDSESNLIHLVERAPNLFPR